MAYLNKQEREDLQQQLRGMKFNQAKGKVRGMDNNSRLAYFRNAQQQGKLYTRYVLPGLGTQITLVEASVLSKKTMDEVMFNPRKASYELLDVMVEALPDNRT